MTAPRVKLSEAEAAVDKAIKAAVRAHNNLNIFAAVVSILEGGHVYSESYPTADRIIDICKREQAKCLRLYDAALLAAGRAALLAGPREE